MSTTPEAEVVLHRGRERSLRRRHPWVLSGAVAELRGEGAPGAWVCVRSAEGELLGHGHYSPRSDIRVRLVAFGKESPGEGWLAERIRQAIAWRAGHPLLSGTDALRLVNAEGDGLPGLVVDRYAEVVVIRPSAAGMFSRVEEAAEAVRDATGAACGLLWDDVRAARREGLPARRATLWGAPPSAPVSIHERGRRYRVDLQGGQKTGFYLDQRDARDLVGSLARGRRVLDLFSYTGGFAVAAAVGGADHVTLVDSSRDALALAEKNLSGLPSGTDLVCADAFRFLRDGDERFQLLVVDPPPLARRKSEVARSTRAYKDLLLHALRRTTPGGQVLAFSCSHHVGPDLFRKVAFGASLDAGRPVQVLGTLEAPADHPVSLDRPEGRYLTGLWLRVP
jgi:23S rRNA (cytosine1962-C5)-methyltransferase